MKNLCIFVVSKQFEKILKLNFHDKELSVKGSNNESVAHPVLDCLDNPKTAALYIKLFSMSKEKNLWEVAELLVSYKPTHNKKVKITSTKTAHKILLKMWDSDLLNIQEQFCVLFINNDGQVLGFRCLHTGTQTSAIVDLKLLFSICCKVLAKSIIIAHNHPSGQFKISAADTYLTKKISKVANLLDIKLLDHIILVDKEYISLSEIGVI